MDDLGELSDAELIALYERTDPCSPDVDVIADEMERRGIDY